LWWEHQDTYVLKKHGAPTAPSLASRAANMWERLYSPAQVYAVGRHVLAQRWRRFKTTPLGRKVERHVRKTPPPPASG
jgi:hypothetical protein